MRVVIGACWVLAGCFVADALNSPPTVRLSCDFADGRPCVDESIVHQGDRVRLHMTVSDPDGNQDPSTYGWMATACRTGRGTGCASAPFDAQHYDEERGTGLELEIPMILPGDARSISVDFEVRDDRGAIGPNFLVFHLTDEAAGRGVGSP